jgi:deoxyuridine 5'-triphosphate nucleotidohydrolase
MHLINNQVLFTVDSCKKAYLSGYIQGISTRFFNETLFIKHNNIVKQILDELSELSKDLEQNCKIDFIELHPEVDFVILNHYDSNYELIDKKFQTTFLRGLFDNSNNVFDLLHPKSVITSHNVNFLQQICSITEIPSVIVAKEYYYSLEFLGYNALDFCHIIYQDKQELYKEDKYNHYLELCTFTNLSDDCTPFHSHSHSFKYTKNLPEAELPFKERASDSGYDLTLVKELKKVGNVTFYDTGISVQPPFGMYFDLIGRSSISKSGYILANNMGIIDRSYTGNIIVPLIKINPDAPDLELPKRLVQIIPRHIIHLQPVQVNSLDISDRNTGGFGSTN